MEPKSNCIQILAAVIGRVTATRILSLISATAVFASGAAYAQQSSEPEQDWRELMRGVPGLEEYMKAEQVDDRPRQIVPEGVLAPEQNAVTDAFERLAKVSAYRERMVMIMGHADEAMQAGINFGPMEKTVVGPDLQSFHWRTEFPNPGMPGGSFDVEIRTVSKGDKMARRIDSRFLETMHRQGQTMQAAMMAEQSMSMAQGFAGAMSGDPFAVAEAISGKMYMAQAAAMTAYNEQQFRKMGMFTWSCEPLEKKGSRNANQDTARLLDLKSLGERTIDGVAVQTYEFFGQQEDELYGPLQLHVDAASGLPFRLEMDSVEGGIRIDYVDIGQAATIELPECLSS